MKVLVSYQEIWRISWPIMLSSMANTVINFTDIAFVSRVSQTALAASALGGVYYFLLVMVITAVGIGGQIIISRKAGEDDRNQIGYTFDHSFLLMLSVALLMSFCIYFPTPYLLPAIIDDSQIAIAVNDYLFARGWGLVPMGVLISFRSFYTGISTTRIISYTTFLMMISNVVLNYAFVFGHLGFQPMGLAGAGLASAVAETLAAVYAVIYSFYHREIKLFRLFRFGNLSLDPVRLLLKISAPLVMQNLLSMGAWFFFFLLIEKVGEVELAVSNVVRGVYMVLMTPVWGFSQASNSMVSNLIGQKREGKVLLLVRKICSLSLLTGSIGIMMGLLLAKPLLQLTTSQTEILEASYDSYSVVCIATLLFSVSMVLLSAISGIGKTLSAMNIEIICLLAYIIYAVVFTLILPASLFVIWGAEVVYWALMGILSFLYLRSGKWRGGVPI